MVDPDGADVQLTSMEFDLLCVFARHPRQILSRDQLCRLAHNRDIEPGDRSIDIRITRLRKKFETEPDAPAVLVTVRGEGYVYEPAQAEARRR
jgi:DNA-binding response OmpR family regulator